MQKKKLLIVISSLFVISSLIFFSSSASPIQFLVGIVQSIYSKPKAVTYAVFASNNPENPEVQKLKQENAALSKRLIDFAKIKRENEALRSQFDESQTAQENLMPVRVVGSRGAPNNPDVLIVDRGKRNGIKTGSSVVVSHNLVGVIGKTSDHYSEVTLITNPKFSTIGLINDNNARGIVKGAEDFIVLDRVVITDSIQKGDLVLSRGDVKVDGTGVLPDLVIGKIAEVNKSESDPFQTARIDSVLKFGNLTYVFVNN